MIINSLRTLAEVETGSLSTGLKGVHSSVSDKRQAVLRCDLFVASGLTTSQQRVTVVNALATSIVGICFCVSKQVVRSTVIWSRCPLITDDYVFLSQDYPAIDYRKSSTI